MTARHPPATNESRKNISSLERVLFKLGAYPINSLLPKALVAEWRGNELWQGGRRIDVDGWVGAEYLQDELVVHGTLPPLVASQAADYKERLKLGPLTVSDCHDALAGPGDNVPPTGQRKAALVFILEADARSAVTCPRDLLLGAYLHVLGVDSEVLQALGCVYNPDVAQTVGLVPDELVILWQARPSVELARCVGRSTIDSIAGRKIIEAMAESVIPEVAVNGIRLMLSWKGSRYRKTAERAFRTFTELPNTTFVRAASAMGLFEVGSRSSLQVVAELLANDVEIRSTLFRFLRRQSNVPSAITAQLRWIRANTRSPERDPSVGPLDDLLKALDDAHKTGPSD